MQGRPQLLYQLEALCTCTRNKRHFKIKMFAGQPQEANMDLGKQQKGIRCNNLLQGRPQLFYHLEPNIYPTLP